jgi:tRNA(Ile)-lysidine synthase
MIFEFYTFAALFLPHNSSTSMIHSDDKFVARTQQRVREYIAEQQLLPPADELKPDATGFLPRVVVGLSGGPDSVALAHILCGLGYPLMLTHCHFGLRGAEADRDLEFCRELAAKLVMPFRCVKFDTRNYAAAHHVSIEMACRELRYDWWQREFFAGTAASNTPTPNSVPNVATDAMRKAQAGHYLRLCVGHHADDSAETFIMNMMRGTGLRGLVGIPPRNGVVVRPLLCLKRDEIMEYLDAALLCFVTDSTNLETDVLRNKIRVLLLPFMEELNSNTRHGMAETMHHLREALLLAERGRYELVERFVDSFRRDGVTYSRLSRRAFAATGDFPAEGMVHAFLQDRCPMSRALEVEIAAAVMAGKKNVQFSTHEATLFVEAEALVLCVSAEVGPAETLLSMNRYFDIAELPYNEALSTEIHQNSDSETAFVDGDKLTLPLTVRHWREGDRLRPLGMRSGSKLVSDLFSNAHFSPTQKAWTWVVVNGDGRIVWVTGLRVADDFKVNEATHRVCRLHHDITGGEVTEPTATAPCPR